MRQAVLYSVVLVNAITIITLCQGNSLLIWLMAGQIVFCLIGMAGVFAESLIEELNKDGA